MEVTATTDVKTGPYSGVKFHNEHNPEVNHDNKDIDFSKSKYNVIGHCANYEKILERQYGGSALRAHNESQKKNRHYDRMYSSGVDWAKHMKSSPDEKLVAKFSDKATRDEIRKHLIDAHPNDDPDKIDEKLLKAYADGFKRYVNGFNKRNKCMTLCEYAVHVDELGAHHVHAQVVPCGHTPSGKPSASFDSAVKEQYGTAKKPAMEKWREQEDKALVRNVSKSLRSAFPELKQFKLYRKNEHNGLDHDEYVAQQQQKRDAQRAQDRYVKLNDVNQRLTSEIQSKREQIAEVDALEEKKKEIYAQIRESNRATKRANEKKAEADAKLNEFYDFLESGYDAYYSTIGDRFKGYDYTDASNTKHHIDNPYPYWSGRSNLPGKNVGLMHNKKRGLPLLIHFIEELPDKLKSEFQTKHEALQSEKAEAAKPKHLTAKVRSAQSGIDVVLQSAQESNRVKAEKDAKNKNADDFKAKK